MKQNQKKHENFAFVTRQRNQEILISRRALPVRQGVSQSFTGSASQSVSQSVSNSGRSLSHAHLCCEPFRYRLLNRRRLFFSTSERFFSRGPEWGEKKKTRWCLTWRKFSFEGISMDARPSEKRRISQVCFYVSSPKRQWYSAQHITIPFLTPSHTFLSLLPKSGWCPVWWQCACQWWTLQSSRAQLINILIIWI